MDPNETLKNARLASDRLSHSKTPDEAMSASVDLMMHFDALDRWVSQGGFLPADWAPRTDSETQQRGMYVGRRQVSPRGF